MSYILNALRKSEQERQAQKEETLNSRILEQKVKTDNKTPVWLILMILINAGIFGYFMFQYLEKPEAELKTIEKPLIPTAKVVVAEELEGIEENSETILPKTHKPLTIDDIIYTKKLQTGKISQQPEIASSQQPLEKMQVAETMPVKKQELKQLKNTIPLLSELPYQFRRHVPDIAINVFVYSDEPENRFIMVSMQKHVSGQEISEGMVLKEIQADGIVVEFKGKVFKIKRS